MTIIKQVSVETGPQALLAGRNEAVGVTGRPRAGAGEGRERAGAAAARGAACPAGLRRALPAVGRAPGRGAARRGRRGSPAAALARETCARCPAAAAQAGEQHSKSRASPVELLSWTGRAGAPPPNGRRALNSASRSTALLEAACARAPLTSRAALKQSRGRDPARCEPLLALRPLRRARGGLPAGQRERGMRVCAAAAPVPQWPPTLNPTSLQWRRCCRGRNPEQNPARARSGAGAGALPDRHAGRRHGRALARRLHLPQ
jgi:hypothetical protein